MKRRNRKTERRDRGADATLDLNSKFGGRVVRGMSSQKKTLKGVQWELELQGFCTSITCNGWLISNKSTYMFVLFNSVTIQYNLQYLFSYWYRDRNHSNGYQQFQFDRPPETNVSHSTSYSYFRWLDGAV